MRTAFFLYAFLALIDALLIWQMGSGPIVLSVTFSGIVLYVIGREIMGSRFDFTRAAAPVLVFVTAILTRHGTGEIVLFLGALASLHVYIAESCAHHAASVKTGGISMAPRLEMRMFSYAFYVSLWPAYLLLSGKVFGLPEWQAIVAAAVVVVLSFLGWEFGRVIALRQGQVKQRSTFFDRLAGISLATACFGLLLLLFTYAVPGLTAGISSAAKDLKQGLGVEEEKVIGDPKKRGQVGMSDKDRYELPSELDLDDSRRSLDLFVQIGDSEIARRMSESPIYVRTAVHNRFTASRWMASEEVNEWIEDTNGDGRVIVSSDENKIPAPVVDHIVYLVNDGGNDLPALQGVAAFDLNRVFLHADDWYQVNRKENIAYRAQSVPRLFEDLVATGQPIDMGVDLDPAYTKLEGSDFIWDLQSRAQSVSLEGSPLKERLLALRRYLHNNYRYSLKIDNPGRIDPVVNFLKYEKRGNCDYFATVGALMLRAIGVPSRIAYGYSGGDYEPKRKIFTFYNNHAHTWTEINLRGHGWVIFDFTPPGEGNLNPAQTVELPEEEMEEGKFQWKDGKSGDGEQTKPGESPGTTKEGQEGKEDAVNEEESEGTSNDALPDDPEDSPLRAELLISIVAGALGVFALSLGILWLLRHNRGTEEGKAGTEKEEAPLPGYVTDLFQLCQRVGYPREEGETLREIESGLSKYGILHADNELRPMMEYHYQVRYEGGNRENDRESAFRKLIRTLIDQWNGRSTEEDSDQ